ncbi:MAG: efflux RND transporter periplasmic adaptor subunit [Bacteroidetes bacterium]|nr:efflux RND transporter periplasmic adaptor subunit [Bacteroidota bacterium]
MNSNVVSRMLLCVGMFTLIYMTSCKHEEHTEHETHESGILPVTNPIKIDTTVFDEFVCQIHSFQHIDLRAQEKGFLQKILVDEGQFVKKGQLLFQIQQTIYQAEVGKAKAELEFAQIEYQNTKALADSNIVSPNELALANATLQKAKAELALSQTHLSFTEIRAPFNGIVGKFEDVRLGSLLDEGELLTTLSDNSKMWVYFNVPEVQYLDYATSPKASTVQKVKLRLANNYVFPQEGIIETIESDFNNTTGNIAFRATFQNPNSLLRHGQTGTILWADEVKNVLAIPQKATFEVLDKKYVFIVDKEGHISSKEIKIIRELHHIYLLAAEGLSIEDQILLEGLRKVQSGDKIEYKYENPSSVFSHLDVHAE